MGREAPEAPAAVDLRAADSTEAGELVEAVSTVEAVVMVADTTSDDGAVCWLR